MEYLLYGGGFILLVLAGLRVFRVVNLMSFSLRTPVTELVSMDQVPRHILLALAPGGKELRRLGFTLSHCSRSLNFNAGIKSPNYSAVYHHPDFGCYVDLAINLLPDRDFPYQANFYSFFEDGLVFLTTNFEAYSIVDDCPTLIAQDGNGLTLVEQFSAHCEAVSELESATDMPARLPPMTPEQMVEALRESFKAYTDFLLESGYSHQVGDHYRLRPATAWRMASLIVKGEKALSAMLKRAAESNGAQRLDIDDREMLTIEVDAFQRHRQVQENSSSLASTKGALLLITIVLFGAVFGVTWSLQSVLILIGVILFHELGHVLAMRLCGYRDLQILFIPFLGAAAMGKADNPRPWQKAFVSLMGPLPGIVLGAVVALYFGIQNEFLFELVVILLLVNFLNLLPIMPLDGGQLLNAVLFSHHPRWEFGFYVVSVLLMFGLAVLLDGPVMLVFAVLLATQIPAQYQHMTLSLALLSTDDSGEKDPRRRAFKAMGAREKQQPFAAKIQEARGLVERLAQIKPTALEATGCMAVYLAVLLSPAGFAGHWLSASFSPYEVETDWDAEIAQTNDLPGSLAVHVEAANDYMAANDYERAFQYLETARQNAEAASYRGDEYFNLLETMAVNAYAAERDAVPLYRRLLDVNKAHYGRNSEKVANANYLLAHHLFWVSGTAESAAQYAEESSRIRRNLGDPEATYTSLMLLARIQEENERFDDTEATLLEAVDISLEASDGPGQDYVSRSNLAAFYVRRDRPQEALQQLEKLLDSSLEEYETLHLRREAATVHMLLGQGLQARALLRQAYAQADTDYVDDFELSEYSFMMEGSPHRHVVEIAATYWAEGDWSEAQHQLDVGAREYGDEFTELLARHMEDMRGWEDEADSEIPMEFNRLLVDMAVDLEMIAAR